MLKLRADGAGMAIFATCIRMSQEEYDLLKEKSRAAGLSANAWLMRELERNRPRLYREKETKAAIALC